METPSINDKIESIEGVLSKARTSLTRDGRLSRVIEASLAINRVLSDCYKDMPLPEEEDEATS